MATKPIDLLWTSGWDSTFRIADLVIRQARTVQPWYVRDDNRRSTGRELSTMQEIRTAIADIDPSAGTRILPLREFSRETIPADAEITSNYRRLAQESHLGNQYDWLARLAKSEGRTLELSIHRDDKAHGFLENDVVEDGDTYRLSDDADPRLALFRWFSFPVFNTSKLDMAERAREHGFQQVMELTWFCYEPLIGGKPCGYCNPCVYTQEEGLGRRVPRRTSLNNAQRRALNAMWKVRRKLRR